MCSGLTTAQAFQGFHCERWLQSNEAAIYVWLKESVLLSYSCTAQFPKVFSFKTWSNGKKSIFNQFVQNTVKVSDRYVYNALTTRKVNKSHLFIWQTCAFTGLWALKYKTKGGTPLLKTLQQLVAQESGQLVSKCWCHSRVRPWCQGRVKNGTYPDVECQERLSRGSDGWRAVLRMNYWLDGRENAWREHTMKGQYATWCFFFPGKSNRKSYKEKWGKDWKTKRLLLSWEPFS